jgi:hypothetical protein
VLQLRKQFGERLIVSFLKIMFVKISGFKSLLTRLYIKAEVRVYLWYESRRVLSLCVHLSNCYCKECIKRRNNSTSKEEMKSNVISKDFSVFHYQMVTAVLLDWHCFVWSYQGRITLLDLITVFGEINTTLFAKYQQVVKEMFQHESHDHDRG